MIGAPDGFGREVELHEAQYDPTYGSDEPGIFPVHTCQGCCALVDGSGLDEHTAWHNLLEARSVF